MKNIRRKQILSGLALIILAVAFAASAIYAYKKVTDYNL